MNEKARNWWDNLTKKEQELLIDEVLYKMDLSEYVAIRGNKYVKKKN